MGDRSTMSLLSTLNPPPPAWTDARVWIVGASTGIGAATAKLLRLLPYRWYFAIVRKATGV